MTFIDAARRIARTSRRHGIGAGMTLLTLAAARRAFTIERSYILELREPPEVPAQPGRQTRLASEQDIVDLAREPIWDLDSDAVDALGRGHRCVLNVLDGQVAGYAWMNPNRLIVPRLRAAFSLHPGEAHIYKGFTHPDHRGRNLGVDRFAFWLTSLDADARPQRLLTDFAFDNFATLARARRTGLLRIATGTYLARGDYAKRILSAELDARALDPISGDLPHRDH